MSRNRSRASSIRRRALRVAPLVLSGALAVGLAGPAEALPPASSASYATVGAASSQPVLLYGSTGGAVRTLQARLGVRVDGDFRSETLAAVRRLQARKGLVVDGVVGPATWGALGLHRPSAGRTAGYSNGRLPASELCRIDWAAHERLRCDADRALTRLNEAYRARFGRNLDINDAYRSYAEQVAIKKKRGRFAARPGTSNHGWGKAVDLGGGVNRFGSSQHTWMRANAPRYGWVHPSWARANGSLPEPWHWEFTG